MKSKKIIQTNLPDMLYLIATPIGNLKDISNRAIKTLKEVDLIICENTKHSLKLLNNLGIKKRLISLHDYNEERIIKKISRQNKYSTIGLISDAGSPLISDPGYKLLRFMIKNNINVISIPGASSVISSLQISGLPINNFAFYGFAPKQKSKRKQFYIKIKDINLTSIVFVSAKNLEINIKDIVDIFKNREITVCKEITKLNEEIFRGSATNILKLLKEQKITLKGEFTVVISNEFNESSHMTNNKIKPTLIKLFEKYSLTEAVKIVHNLSNISKKVIYQMAIKLKND